MNKVTLKRLDALEVSHRGTTKAVVIEVRAPHRQEDMQREFARLAAEGIRITERTTLVVLTRFCEAPQQV